MNSVSPPRLSWDYDIRIRLYGLRESLCFALGRERHRRKQEKYRAGFDDYVGFPDPAVPRNALYVYARGAGEVQTALPLLRALKNAGLGPCVLAVRTADGHAMAKNILREEIDALVYAPWDVPLYVRRTLDRLAPRACLFIDLEPVPAPILLNGLLRRNIPSFLVNGYIPKERETTWSSRPHGLWSGVLDCFEKIMLRSPEEKEKFMRMGLAESKLIVTGNGKVDALFARRDGSDFSRWHSLRSEAPVLLAGSTRQGEDEIVLEAFEQVRRSIPSARMILAPRFLKDTERIVPLFSSYRTTLLTRIENPEGSPAGLEEWEVAIVDRMGILFELYSIADAAFIGGSLVPEGGHNLMEPAVFGIPVTHGPHMKDFPEAEEMDEVGASRTVRNADELARAWLEALDPAYREKCAAACSAWFESVGGATGKNLEIIDRCLKSD